MSVKEITPKPPTKQKYCLVYSDSRGELTFELIDYKRQLRERLQKLDTNKVHVIIKGRMLKIRMEERLTV